MRQARLRKRRALIESCLRTRTHYLDITGELPVFRDAFGHDAAARKRGIMSCLVSD